MITVIPYISTAAELVTVMIWCCISCSF